MRSYVMYLYCNLHINANVLILSLTILGSVELRAPFFVYLFLEFNLSSIRADGTRKPTCVISVRFCHLAKIAKREKLENR